MGPRKTDPVDGPLMWKPNPLPSWKKTHLFVPPPPSSCAMNTFGRLVAPPVLTTLRLAQSSRLKSFEPKAHAGLSGT